MSISIEESVWLVTQVFSIKCQQLARHRHPNIYLRGNNELFSDWFETGLEEYEAVKLGANSHPDLIINGLGIELKSLKTNGQIQFNSTIPCGGFQHGAYAGECYYAVARYSTDRNYGYLEDFTICDGDFFNHDREMAFAHSNDQDTGFGDYGDGVIRYRKMYSFPSPLRTVPGVSLISKYDNLSDFDSDLILDGEVTKEDVSGIVHTFSVYRHKLIGY